MDDGAENEKILNPHPSDSDTDLIIKVNYLAAHENTKASNNMRLIEIIMLGEKWQRYHHQRDRIYIQTDE